MANIQINKYTTTETAVSYDLTVGKRDIFMSIKRDGSYLNVMCKNASHQAYQGTGRHFWGSRVLDQAKETYKSSEMRSALEFLRRERDL